MLDNIRIVLVKTFHPGNIGSTARAMKNMGLTRLYLVDPKDFPSFEASQMASSATDILKEAVVVDSLADALQGCSLVVGTTARMRSVQWPQIDSRECGELLVTEGQDKEVALVFGRERTGLHNDELELCQYLVNIPTGEEYTSLNVAQAVQVLCYDILMASRSGQEKAVAGNKDPKDREATSDQLEGMYDHMFDTMQSLDFFGERNPEHVMRRMRCMFGRARPTVREVQIMRGLFSSVLGNRSAKKRDS